MNNFAYDLGHTLGKTAQTASAFNMPQVTVSQPQMIQNAMPGQAFFGQSAPGNAQPAPGMPTSPNQPPAGNLQNPPPKVKGDGLVVRSAYTGGDTSSPPSGGEYFGEQPQGSPLPSTRFSAESIQRSAPPKPSKDRPVGNTVRKLNKSLRLDTMNLS